MSSQTVKYSKCLNKHLPLIGKKCKNLQKQDQVPLDQTEEASEARASFSCHQREAAALNVQIQMLEQSVNRRLDSMEGEVGDIKRKSASEKISSRPSMTKVH